MYPYALIYCDEKCHEHEVNIRDASDPVIDGDSADVIDDGDHWWTCRRAECGGSVVLRRETLVVAADA